MKKYFISTHTRYLYDKIDQTEHKDSLELYNSLDECMEFVYQNLLVTVSHIEELQQIRRYFTLEMLRKPEINYSIASGNAKCTLTKTNNILKLSIRQSMVADGKTVKLSIEYSFVPNEIDTDNIGYIVYGVFDSDIHSYTKLLSEDVYSSIKEVKDYVDTILNMKMKNLCDFNIAIVDKTYVDKEGIDKYQKEKERGYHI